MEFAKALILAKNQIGYERYRNQIHVGQMPSEYLPLLNALVNTLADIYSDPATTTQLSEGFASGSEIKAACQNMTASSAPSLLTAIYHKAPESIMETKKLIIHYLFAHSGGREAS